ncbi:MAG TPA: hypothetical protein VK085_00470 [Pseudogracilibacillus sp.]|nr:hypothetical protein [Pseudogracilibacillus sp.]
MSIIVLSACTDYEAILKENSQKAKEQRELAESTADDEANKNDPEQEAKEEKIENVNENDHQEARKEKADTDAPNPAEIQQIVEISVNEIHQIVQNRTDKIDWKKLDINTERDAALEKALQKLINPLSAVVAADNLHRHAEEFIEIFTCQCDSMHMFRDTDTRAGFTIIDYSDDAFEAESITLTDGALYSSGWKNKWSFKKEDGYWKFNDYDVIYADREPLDVTFEDIEHSFYDYETNEKLQVEFVEYTDEADGHYIVVQMPDQSYMAYHTELGLANFELGESYQ